MMDYAPGSFACAPGSPSGCDCRPKEYLSCAEEAALSEMRRIKFEARGLMSRLDELKRDERAEEPEEAARVRVLLGDLRERWESYARNLDIANEQKMVFLGHRPGPA